VQKRHGPVGASRGPRLNPARPTWRLPMAVSLHQQTSQEPLISSTCTSGRPLTQCPATSFSPSCKDTDAMGGLFDGQRTGRGIESRERRSVAPRLDGDWWRVASQRGPCWGWDSSASASVTAPAGPGAHSEKLLMTPSCGERRHSRGTGRQVTW